jgi:hypothetical protein
MKLNYNEWLTLAFWEYNRYPDEELTLELFQETFGSVPGAHYYEKWVYYYEEPAGHDGLFQRRGGQRAEVL